MNSSALIAKPAKTQAKHRSSESTSAATLSARRPAWLSCDELQRAIAETNDLVPTLSGQSTEQLRTLVRASKKNEISFISNAEFEDSAAGTDVFADSLGLVSPEDGKGFKAGRDLPVHLSRLCEAPLLTQNQERLLFRRMNFLLQQAANHQSHLNVDRPSRARLELIGRLIALAEWHRDRIVEANLRLVFSIVKKFVNPNNNFDDLLSDGIIGLIRAVEKFDYDRGFRFSTYATQVVRRNSYRTVVVKQQERQRMVGGLQEMDLDVSDEQRTSAISEKRWTLLRKRLSGMLDDLDRREKLIIRARFALGSHRRVRTLQSLADRLGISKERVRQLEKRAMEKLQSMAGEAGFAEADV
jgi:RNA polymerase primary sigma factor